MRSVYTVLLIALFFLVIDSQAATRKVPQDFAKIQLAINAAVNGDTVLVSEGTYVENIRINKKITLASQFYLDKDTSHISKTILDGSAPTNADSASVVTIDGATDTTTMIVGFTIKGGKGNLRATTDNPPLVYRVGLGIDIAGGGATIYKNLITLNNVSTVIRVSAVVNIWDLTDANGISFVIVEDNTISDNVINGAPTVEGGALAIGHNCRIIRNRILRNSITGTTGGYGAAAQIWNGTITFDGNLIANNYASHWGGAIEANQYGTLVPTITLVNNIFANNSAGTQGGALWISGTPSTIISINNTFVGNTSPTGNAVYMVSGSIKALNTILWNPGGTEVVRASGSIAASYSDIRGGYAGAGNINVDPIFVANDSLYHLSNSSLCIGAGVSSASVGGVQITASAKDYAGSSRPNPSWSKPDLGAMESAQAFPGVAHAYNVPKDFAKIQAAINATVNGDVVLVSEGTYKENLVIKKKITLASLFYQDKDTLHISKTIIDGSSPSHSDSMSVVTVDGATDTTTVITGFTITGGKGNRRLSLPPQSWYWRTGTGININHGGARISNNIIRANNNNNVNDTIAGSVSVWDPMDINGVSFAIIENNVISDNVLTGKTVESAGLLIGNSSIIRNNIIARNTNSASIQLNGTAGGASIWNGTVLLSNNRITHNSAPNVGGGVLVYADPTYPAIPIITMVNNIIMYNSSGTYGGGMYLTSNLSSLSSVNNTISMNIAGLGGSGIGVEAGMVFKAVNTILWNPTGTEINIFSGGSVTAQYSNVRGGLVGTGNIDSDPLFKSTNIDSLGMFFSNSPCKNKGINTATVGGIVLNAPYRDYYGSVRPPTSTPDIGAFEDGTWTGVRELISNNLPSSFALSQNYPNPFNPTTTIRYSLPSSTNVKLSVYDLLGREIATLVNEEQSAGWKEVQWNASTVSSGIYFYKLTAGNFIEIKKMSMIK